MGISGFGERNSMLHMQQARQKMRETAETRPKSGTTVSEEWVLF